MAGLLALGLMMAGCAVNPATGKKELALFQVSTGQEIVIGEKAFPQAVQQLGGEYPDEELNAYVDRVGQRLGRLSQRPDLPYRFRVVNDSTPNAFALPGGFIAITRGLLVHLENEAQLASVLGHEVGHVAARHSVQGLQRGALFDLALGVLSNVTADTSYGALAQQAGQMTAGLLEMSYSREQEREADLLGIDYMVRSGYDPQGAVQVQEFFYRTLEGGAEPMWLAGLFRSHPFSRERMEDNEAYIRANYPQSAGLNFGAQAFQLAIAPLTKVQPGYQLYDEARRLESEGDLSAAISTYLRAADRAPEESLILTALGLAYLKAGDVGSARLHLSKAVRLDGDYYQSRMGYGYALLELERTGEAVPQLEKSMELLPTLQGAYLLATGYEKTGRTGEARQLYQAVVEADSQGRLGQAAAARLDTLGAL